MGVASTAQARPVLSSAPASCSQIVCGRPVVRPESLLPYTRNYVEIVHGDGAARVRAFHLVSTAGPHSFIRLETSSFHGADASRLAMALARRATAGSRVEVRLQNADPVLVDVMSAAGVHVRPEAGAAEGSSLSVDGQSMVGSWAWSKHDNLSQSVLVGGPASTALTGSTSPGAPQDSFNAWTRVLRNDATHSETRDALLAQIRAARHTIFIEARGLRDGEIVRALKDASDQGVDVNVLLEHSAGDFSKGVNNLGAAVEFSEPDHQIPFRWFEDTNGQHLTAMTAVFDSQTVLVASDDWATTTHASSRDVLVNDPHLAEDARFQMMMDWQTAGHFAPVIPPAPPDIN